MRSNPRHPSNIRIPDFLVPWNRSNIPANPEQKLLWVMPSKKGGDDATHTHNKEADFSLSLTHTPCTTLNKNNHYLGRTLPCRCISRQGLPAAAFYINSVSTAGPCSIPSPPLQPLRSTTLAPSETICTTINVVSLVVIRPNSRSPDGQCGGTNSAEGLSIRHILLHARVGCHAYGLSVWMHRAAADWWLATARRSLGVALPS